MCDPTLEKARDDALRVNLQAVSDPLKPAIGVLTAVVVGSAAWILLLFAFWSVRVLARC
jgi:multisubunit Na+/H+ antiporter MnhC subunit